ncbi:MAG: molybdopterin converting factor subunit 1 [Siphonobacter sp.]
MELTIQLFGITRDIIGQSRQTVFLQEGDTVQELLNYMKGQYPGLSELKSLVIAVNDDYAEPNQKLNQHDEIALIPPVSGG